MRIRRPICSEEGARQIPATGIHFWLAGALGLKGDLDEARAALVKALELKPEVGSLAQYQAQHPWETNPEYLALRAKTRDAGLRRAGFPDE
jgi:adenylate cyclase